MLAHVTGHKGIALGQTPDGFHDRLGLDDLGAVLVAQAVELAPVFDLLPPGFQMLGGRLLTSGHGFLQLTQQLSHDLFDITDDRRVDPHALGDARRVNVHVNDLARVLGKVLGVAITRSSKRAPMATKTSQCCMAMLHS